MWVVTIDVTAAAFGDGDDGPLSRREINATRTARLERHTDVLGSVVASGSKVELDGRAPGHQLSAFDMLRHAVRARRVRAGDGDERRSGARRINLTCPAP